MLSEITVPNYRKKFLKQLRARMQKKNPDWNYSIKKVLGGYELTISWED